MADLGLTHRQTVLMKAREKERELLKLMTMTVLEFDALNMLEKD